MNGKKNNITKRFANTVIRLFSLGSRFLFVFGIAKLLEVSEVGLYGKFSALISFSFLLLGADYYNYTQRELLNKDVNFKVTILHHIKALSWLYMFLLPIFSIIFIANILPIKLIFWFYVILIVEHISQEINRILIVIDKQITASVALFFR